MIEIGYGFFLGLGLIISLGPQNCFLIQQAVHHDRHYTCALLCTFCDFILIASSVLGVGHFLMSYRWIELSLLIMGVAFLSWYGIKNLVQGLKGIRYL